MTRAKTGAALACAAVLWALPAPAETVTAGGGGVRVVDGDTVVLNGRGFDLRGIDAPELGQTGFDDEGRTRSCGRASRRALAQIIGGRRVICLPVGSRADAFCTVHGIDLGGWMVGQGWALSPPRAPRGYAPEQAVAKANRAGLWAWRCVAPWVWRGQ